MGDIDVERGVVKFSVSQEKPIPWEEIKPLFERSIHNVREIRAVLEGEVAGNVLTLSGSGQTMKLSGRVPFGAGRRSLCGKVLVRDGAAVLELGD